MPLHISHSLQGFPSVGFKQFTALENIFATDVFLFPLFQKTNKHDQCFPFVFGF